MCSPSLSLQGPGEDIRHPITVECGGVQSSFHLCHLRPYSELCSSCRDPWTVTSLGGQCCLPGSLPYLPSFCFPGGSCLRYQNECLCNLHWSFGAVTDLQAFLSILFSEAQRLEGCGQTDLLGLIQPACSRVCNLLYDIPRGWEIKASQKTQGPRRSEKI